MSAESAAYVPLRLRAAWHELRCWECRVTWRSWAQRLVGLRRGYSPSVSPRGFTAADHRNGHHTGFDRSCWRCWLRAWAWGTPAPTRPSDNDGSHAHG